MKKVLSQFFLVILCLGIVFSSGSAFCSSFCSTKVEASCCSGETTQPLQTISASCCCSIKPAQEQVPSVVINPPPSTSKVMEMASSGWQEKFLPDFFPSKITATHLNLGLSYLFITNAVLLI